MEPTHRYPSFFDSGEAIPKPAVAVSGEESAASQGELRQLAEDIVKYCPGLASMLIAFRSCPPYLGLN